MCVDKGSDLMPIGEVIKDTGNDTICPRRKIQLKNGATMERMSDSFRLFCIVEVCEDYPCEMVKRRRSRARTLFRMNRTIAIRNDSGGCGDDAREQINRMNGKQYTFEKLWNLSIDWYKKCYRGGEKR